MGRLLLVTDSVVDHYVNHEANKGVTMCRSLFGCKALPAAPRLAREYFRWRNAIWVARRHQRGRARLYLDVARLFWRRLRHTLLYGDHKTARLRILGHATFSGLFGVFDNAYPQRVLAAAGIAAKAAKPENDASAKAS